MTYKSRILQSQREKLNILFVVRNIPLDCPYCYMFGTIILYCVAQIIHIVLKSVSEFPSQVNWWSSLNFSWNECLAWGWRFSGSKNEARGCSAAEIAQSREIIRSINCNNLKTFTKFFCAFSIIKTGSFNQHCTVNFLSKIGSSFQNPFNNET